MTTPADNAIVEIPPAPAPIGLIAGQGLLPMLVADGIRASGRPVHAVGLAGQYDADLPDKCDRFRQVALLRIGSWGRRLRQMGVTHAVMVGRVDKAGTMHDPLRLIRNIPDWRAIVIWYGRLRHDRRSPALLAVVANELARTGVILIDSTLPIPDQLASVGVMTRRSPTADEQADIDFGWPVLRELLKLGIGQAIAVRERDVIAVEAVEGTDRMIVRTGELCSRSGWMLLKGAAQDHDRRADVPTIGEQTIRGMHSAGGRCMALGAGDVIMVDKNRTIEVANELGVAIVGIERS